MELPIARWNKFGTIAFGERAPDTMAFILKGVGHFYVVFY